MKKLITILSFSLALIILTNTSVFALKASPANGIEFDFEIIDENTLLIRENGEEYILGSIVENNIIFNYLKDKDENIIAYTKHNIFTGETYFSATDKTINIREKNYTFGEDEQIRPLSHPGSSKDNPVKVCSTLGATGQVYFRYSYAEIMDEIGRLTTVAALALTLTGLMGISIASANFSKLVKLAALLYNTLDGFKDDAKYLNTHGVIGVAYKECRFNTTGEFTTWIQDWELYDQE